MHTRTSFLTTVFRRISRIIPNIRLAGNEITVFRRTRSDGFQNFSAMAGRILLLVNGLILCSIGVYLAMQASLGLAPWETFSLQLSSRIGLSYGNTHIAVSVLIILIDLLLHEKIGIGTLTDAVLVGKMVDFMTWLSPIPRQTELPCQILMIFASMTVVAFGQYLYISAGLCCGARDTLLVGTGKKLPSLPVGLIANMIMAVVLAASVMLGGKPGIGLVIQVVFTGPVMQAVFHLMKFDPRSVRHHGLSFRTRGLPEGNPSA